MTYFLYYRNKYNKVDRVNLDYYETTERLGAPIHIEEVLFIEDIPDTVENEGVLRGTYLAMYRIEKKLDKVIKDIEDK